MLFIADIYLNHHWIFLLQLLFAKGMRQFGKNFYKIKKELLPNKEIVSAIVIS